MTIDPRASKKNESAAYERITSSRRRLTWQRELLYRLTVPPAMILPRLLWSTYRIERVIGEEHIPRLLEEDRVFLPTFWHQHLLVCLKYLLDMSSRGLKLGFLVSPSVDGEAGALGVRQIGGYVIRGSSTRTGARAIRDIYKAMQDQHVSPVILPDGPRGPRRRFKPGAIHLSKLSGTPIVPMAFAARRAKILKTWDRFVLAAPWTRAVVAVGEPVHPRITADPESVDCARTELEREMAHLFERARAALKQV